MAQNNETTLPNKDKYMDVKTTNDDSTELPIVSGPPTSNDDNNKNV